MRLDEIRPLPTGVLNPHDWGVVPGTSASDGDPVDALIFSDGGTDCRILHPGHRGRGQGRQGLGMERPFGGARLDWRPLIPLHASHPFGSHPPPTASWPVSLPHSLLQCASCHVCEHA